MKDDEGKYLVAETSALDMELTFLRCVYSLGFFFSKVFCIFKLKICIVGINTLL